MRRRNLPNKRVRVIQVGTWGTFFNVQLFLYFVNFPLDAKKESDEGNKLLNALVADYLDRFAPKTAQKFKVGRKLYLI